MILVNNVTGKMKYLDPVYRKKRNFLRMAREEIKSENKAKRRFLKKWVL